MKFALGAAAVTPGLLASGSLMAGPFDAADFQREAPADKKLDPAWVKSLFARGEREVYRGADLEKIGMPIGGLCAGQLYLGGDGKLWHWDIFNQPIGTGDSNYAHPPKPTSPLEQGFAVKIVSGGKTEVRTLDRAGFADISFCGEYPLGLVEYREPGVPISISLEAFSPFVPLETEASSLPATVMRFTVCNKGSEKAEVDLVGWLENAVCLKSAAPGTAVRRNAVVRGKRRLAVESSIHAAGASNRENIVFDDFRKETFEGWTVEGAAFGKGPILKSKMPAYQGDVGGKGDRVVNSHACGPDGDVGQRDGQTGKLTSKTFTISRDFITFWIGGGNNPGKTCINLVIGDKAVRSATGANDNRMRFDCFDVREFKDKTARLEIVDAVSGPWGNVGIGEIGFSDRPAGELSQQNDMGTMALSLLEPAEGDRVMAAASNGHLPEILFLNNTTAGESSAERPVGKQLVGVLGRTMQLASGAEATATFLITWHFPNLKLKDGGRSYAERFASAGAVAEHVAENFTALRDKTRLWHDTWYDSTLPYWLLDRTFLNTSILASSTCYRFANGRFYGWEGVGCCEGTCTHVWHYAHAVARLFPDLERDLRKRVDFGLAQDVKSGMINHRGEGAGLAVDGQAGCILRAYREQQMSSDASFLKQVWPQVKLAMQCLVAMDDGEGLLEGAQHNTLDQPWFGKVAWLSSLYVAAARACEEMAKEMDDKDFAAKMQQIAARGGASIDEQLFNGEYYVHIPDKDHVRSVGSHNGCEIDQVFGQSWAYQVGLGRIQSAKKMQQALAALWRYNFTPDVGPFRETHKPGRWYAMAGEGGLLMCAWPKGEQARLQEGFDYYFNECMTGFEYQVAGHMVWEGMMLEGLAITRAIHDRYHPSRRNPWNEVECGDHYARAMASYGVFLAACGFECHGPKGYLAFAPKLGAENFRAAFTTAEGWGTFAQSVDAQARKMTIALKFGKLAIRTLAFAADASWKGVVVSVAAQGKPVAAVASLADGRVVIGLEKELAITAGQMVEVTISPA